MNETYIYTGLGTVVIGTGAAGYAAAERLYQQGVRRIAIVTEGVNCGTSRNTGSDKQTYYKLTLTGEHPDSVAQMAETLFSGHCVDGDLALCEAALSVRSFMHLAELGVPFPMNRFGEYVGYKTDHDPAARATSAGPLTSHYMTDCLERRVHDLQIPIFDECPLLRVLSDGHRTYGVLCYDKKEHCYHVFGAHQVVYATGGPAGLYLRSVYPESQHGASGLAFEAGVKGKNLTEWQYGLSSVKFRWNLSGTYQQVLPRYVSTEQDGTDEREFLRDYFETDPQLISNVFLKGYQWPFDPRKVQGSSLIDILVYQETEVKGRRVFLDYRRNPSGLDFEALSEEARTYLENSGACFGTPFERLSKMNPKAIALYRSHGIDLETEWLETAVCAQHNNGGLSGDVNWESDLAGFYPVGEVNGSHGVYRPGGSALNAGQCGAFRAASHIASAGDPEVLTEQELPEVVLSQIKERISQLEALPLGTSTVKEQLREIGASMSRQAAYIRSEEAAKAVEKRAEQALASFWEHTVIDARHPEEEKILAITVYDLLIAQQVYTAAMADAIGQGILSRGSYMVQTAKGTKVHPMLALTCEMDDGSHDGQIQEVSWKQGQVTTAYRAVRPIPDSEQWFETVFAGRG